MQKKALTFKRGFINGIPICLGYLSVSFAFGMVACEKGLPSFAPGIISATSVTGTGQFVGVDLIAAGATFFELIITLAIINARYILMSMSLSQRLDSGVTFWQRLIVAFGNTDEVFAVSMNEGVPLNFRYMLGLISSSYIGWVGGTYLGVIASSVVPASVTSALGISLYAMYIAIILPAAKKSRPVLSVIIISVLLSFAFNNITPFSSLSDGWIIIICGCIAALAGAFLFPVEQEEEYE